MYIISEKKIGMTTYLTWVISFSFSCLSENHFCTSQSALEFYLFPIPYIYPLNLHPKNSIDKLGTNYDSSDSVPELTAKSSSEKII